MLVLIFSAQTSLKTNEAILKEDQGLSLHTHLQYKEMLTLRYFTVDHRFNEGKCKKQTFFLFVLRCWTSSIWKYNQTWSNERNGCDGAFL